MHISNWWRLGGVPMVAVAVLLSACGSESADGTADGAASGTAMNMGDPTATPADEIEGAEIVRGEYEVLDTRPEGYDDLRGMAVIARHPGGTTVTTELSGLLPNTAYIAHVHAQSCANGNGGSHYQFEVGGSDMPPNEIHLAFTSDAEGNGFMTAENDQVAAPEAVAFVVHPVDLIDNKIACVDFVARETS